MDEDNAYNNLRTFIFQRNPELALVVYPLQEAVVEYFKKVLLKLITKSLIGFDNFNSLFISKSGVVETNGQSDIKPYSGKFRYNLEHSEVIKG